VKDDIRRKDGKFFMIKEGNTCIGCINAHLTKTGDAITYGPFAVHPKHTGKGVGSLL